MKIIISIIFSALVGAALLGGPLEMTPLNLETTTLFEKAEPCTLSICITVTGKPSKTKDLCEGLGFRCIKWNLNRRVAKFNPNDLNSENTPILFELISSRQIKISFPSNLDQEKLFNVFEDTELPSIVAKEFGFYQITVLKGDYLVTNNHNGSLSSILKIQTK